MVVYLIRSVPDSTYIVIGTVGKLNGQTWIKFDLGVTQYVRSVTLHYLFMEDFPKKQGVNYWCLNSIDNWNTCVSYTGYTISVENEDGSSVVCGTMELNGTLTQADNIYSFDCDAVGRYVVLSGVSTDITLTEVVVRTKVPG